MNEDILRSIQAEQDAAALAAGQPVPTGASSDLSAVLRAIENLPLAQGPAGADAEISAELIQEILDAATPIKGVDYRDGRDGKNGRDGRDAPVLTAVDIKTMLQSLTESEKLDLLSIKGANKIVADVTALNKYKQRNDADHVFYNQQIEEIWEWIDSVKGLRILQSGTGPSINPVIVASLNDIGDVTITGANPGDIIVWNGSMWVNQAPVIAAGISAENAGTPIAGGPFTTLNYVSGITAADGGGGTLDVTVVGGGSTTLTSTDGSVGLVLLGSNYDLSVDSANIDWTVTNWTDFFTNVDWTVANWTDFFTSFYTNIDWGDFFTNVDWVQFTDWSGFITSWVTNVTAGQWDTFIDEFINNVDVSDINNWIGIWDATNFSTFIASWVANTNPADWDVFIDEFVNQADSDDVFNLLGQIAGLAKGDILAYNGSSWQLVPAGTDGQVLTANSGSAAGVEYQTPSATVAIGGGTVIDNTGFTSVYGMQPSFYDTNISGITQAFYTVAATNTQHAYSIEMNPVATSVTSQAIADFGDTAGSSFITNADPRGYAVQFSATLTQLSAGDKLGIGAVSGVATARDSIFNKVNSATETAGMFIGAEGTTDGTLLRAYTSDGTTGTVTTIGTLDATFQLFSIVIVRDQTLGEARYYVNGSLAATHTTVPTAALNAGFGLGLSGTAQGWLSAPVFNVEL